MYAWLVTPLQVYVTHESIILQDSANLHGDVIDRVAFILLADDPKSRVKFTSTETPGLLGRRAVLTLIV